MEIRVINLPEDFLKKMEVLLGTDMGLVGIWIAMAMDEILRGIVVYIRWMNGKWRGKKVV